MASQVDAMDGADARISNGTCWSGKNTRASDYFIPCGNAGEPDLNFACCYTGDTCLTSNSCYNAIYGITYIAGCTDKNYSAAVCGDKGNYSHQEWMGLVRCYVSDDLTAKDEEWAGCEEDQDTFPVTARACDCKGKKHLFRDNKVLTATVKLPLSSAGSISSLPGYNPTVTQVVTVSATSWETAEGPPVITTPPTQIPAPNAGVSAATSAADSQQRLSTGEEAGVVVGAASAGLLVIGLVLAYVLVQIRKKEAGRRPAPATPGADGEREEPETNVDSRCLEGSLVIHAENIDDDEPHTPQHGRDSRRYLYGSHGGRNSRPSGFSNHRLSTISEHSTIPGLHSPGSSRAPAPPPQVAVDHSEDSTRGRGLGKELPVKPQIHELPG